MAITLNDNIRVAAGKPSEAKYLNSSGTPYTGTTQVNSQIPIGERHIGLTVNVAGVEYWYESGTANGNLVVKSVGGGSANGANGLSVQGDYIVLGGQLTGDTTIDGNGKFLSICNNGSALIYSTGSTTVGSSNSFAQLVSDTDAVAIAAYTQATIYGGAFTSSFAVSEAITANAAGFITLSANGTPDVSGIAICGPTVEVGSLDAGFSGITYGADYSAKFGDRSLVDKAFVLAAIGSGSTGGGSLTGATNGIRLSGGGSQVSLGGTLTGHTIIDTSTYGVKFGAGTGIQSGAKSFIIGCNNTATGTSAMAFGIGNIARAPYSLAGGINSQTAAGTFFCGAFAWGCAACACGHSSHAEGQCTRATATASHAEGAFTCACASNSHAEGCNTVACGLSSHAEGACTVANCLGGHAEGWRTSTFGDGAHSGGYGTDSGKAVIANAKAAFNHSINTGLQTSGHGALASGSTILGGVNHNIASGNARAAIIGGNSIKLSGTSYIDTVAVPNFAVMCTPSTGSGSMCYLVRDSATGIIKQYSGGTGGGGGTSVTANNGLTKAGDNIHLGGSLTGNTVIGSSTYGILFGTGFATGQKTFASGCDVRATGNTSASFGCGSISHGVNSFAAGQNARAWGYNSHAEGQNTQAIGSQAHAQGQSTIAYGINSHAEGNNTCAYGWRSHAQGYRTRACGDMSHTGGGSANGVAVPVIACGIGAFNHSFTNSGQGSGHGANAFSSAILGGINHNINSAATGATILGGNGIKLTGATYLNTTAVAKLAIMSTPAAGTSGMSYLVRDSSTGIIKTLSGGGGGSSSASGISFDPTGTSLSATTLQAALEEMDKTRYLDINFTSTATTFNFKAPVGYRIISTSTQTGSITMKVGITTKNVGDAISQYDQLDVTSSAIALATIKLRKT